MMIDMEVKGDTEKKREKKEISVREKTMQEIVEYIQRYGTDGRLQIPYADIGRDTGYSTTTIHRAIKKLEEQGYIRIIPPDRANEPNTLVLQGPAAKAVDNFLGGPALVRKMRDFVSEFARYVEQAEETIENLRKDLEDWVDFKSRIVKSYDLPDGEHEMIMVKKKKQEDK
jgi:DNA-binding Lrp family transcriptional regulator